MPYFPGFWMNFSFLSFLSAEVEIEHFFSLFQALSCREPLFIQKWIFGIIPNPLPFSVSGAF